MLRLGDELRPILPYLRYFLAVDPGEAAVRTMDPQLRRAELFASLRRLLVRAAEVRPQVLVFEDLHWIDKATEAALLAIADSIPSSRVLCLFTYRPGYIQPFGDRTYYTRLTLLPLSTQDSMQMAQAILATEQLPAALQTLIMQKAEGNPFFVEEVVKSLQEMSVIRRVGLQYVLIKPIEEIVVPDTIQDVLMARIDRLDEVPKQTLQVAAVIGREFTYRLLRRLEDMQERTEASLQALKAIELIYEMSLYPELAYMFKHALTQDVAYNSLLAQRRQELHRRIGQAIEDLYGDRLAEQYEVLAYHFARGEVWAKAFEYFYKAAEKAAQAFATREALTLYDQALEVAGHLRDAVAAHTLMAIHQGRSNLYFVLSNFEQARAEGEHLLILAHQAGDRMSEGAALASMGWASAWGHDFERGLAYARQAIDIATQVDAKKVLASGYFTIGWVHAVTGRLDQTREETHKALMVSQSVGDVSHQSLSLSSTGLLKNWEGEYVQAAQFQSEGLRIACEHNLLVPLLRGLFGYGVILTGQGEYDGARAVLEEGLALSEKVGDKFWSHRLLNSLGWLYMEVGDFDRALDFNQRGAEGAQQRGDPETIANAELNLGDIFLARGELMLAQEILNEVYRLAHDPATSDWMRWRYSMHLFVSLGELWLARGELAKAQEFADCCLEIATRTNSRKYEVRGKRLRGEIALAQHQWEAAETWLRQALLLARTVGNPPQLWKTYIAMGHLFREMRQPAHAQEFYQGARDVIYRIKVTLHNSELRTSLEQSPLTQAIYALSTSG